MGEERAGEGVAGADGVDDRHLGGRDFAGRGGRTGFFGAGGALGQNHQPGAELEPALGRGVEGSVRRQVGKVGAAQSDDVAHGDHALDAGDVAVAVADGLRPDVGVEGDHAVGSLALHERLEGGAAWLFGEAEGAEVEGGDRGRKGRQVIFRQHAAGRAFVEESVARLAGIGGDEGQRRWPRHGRGELRASAAGGERIAEQLAERIDGEAAEEAGGGVEAGDGDGDVERRAATWPRRVGDAAVGGFNRQEIDESFAASDDHGWGI